MANRFLSNIRINDAYTFPASDGSFGQAIITDGAGNLSFGNVASGGDDAASVIYKDNFTGDGTTVAFSMAKSVTTEDQTQIFIDGVYQEKGTYSVSGNVITFSEAPISGHSIEVMTIASINTGPTTLYQDNFTGNGATTDFTLANSVNNEIKTLVFLNGVYQFKDTYSVSETTLSFDTAPANGTLIEVITIGSAASHADIDKLAGIEAGAQVNTLDGSGTANYVSKWSDADTITNSSIQDDGSTVSVGGNLAVTGSLTGTLATAAQTNITSVGTLTTLAVQDGNTEDVSGSKIRMEMSGINPYWEIVARNGGSAGSRKLGLYTSAIGSDVMTLTQSGNVGIGVSPSASFHLGGTDSTKSYIDRGSYTRLQIFQSNDGQSHIGSSGSNAALILRTGTTFGTDTERMRIDSSGNLLVGKTAANLTTTGVEIDPNGILLATKNAGTVAYFNRLTTDGTILDFRKDGSIVGSIGFVTSDNLYIQGNSTHNGLAFDSNALIPFKNGAYTDNVCDIGGSSNRFKDLYLSGGAYLGGNVGIGTQSPTEGNLVVRNDSGNANINIKVNDFDGSDYSPSLDFSTGGQGANDPQAQIKALGDNSYSAHLIFSTQNPGTTNPLVERMRILSSGQVIVGAFGGNDNAVVAGSSSPGYTNQPGTNLLLKSGDGSGTGSSFMSFSTSPVGSSGTTVNTAVERMRIDASGNVGIGVSSPASKLNVAGAKTNSADLSNAANQLVVTDTTATAAGVGGRISFFGAYTATPDYGTFGSIEVLKDNANNYGSASWNNAAMRFIVGNNDNDANAGRMLERMRITSAGEVLIGTTNGLNGKITAKSPSSYTAFNFRSDSSSANNTDWMHFYGTSNSNAVQNIVIFGNGNILNANNSYGQLSDFKIKENIVDATPKLDDLLKVKVRNYNLIGDDNKQIGVVAQELEEVFPSMIDESPDFEEVEVTDEEGNVTTERVDLGTTTKSVKYSVFVPMLIKAVQELKAEIETLKSQING
jgi:hypothetical protein